MSAYSLSKRPVSIGRICTTLAIIFGVFIITMGLLVVLPFRSAGLVSHLLVILYCMAFVFGVAWVALSFLAIPRSLF